MWQKKKRKKLYESKKQNIKAVRSVGTFWKNKQITEVKDYFSRNYQDERLTGPSQMHKVTISYFSPLPSKVLNNKSVLPAKLWQWSPSRFLWSWRERKEMAVWKLIEGKLTFYEQLLFAKMLCWAIYIYYLSPFNFLNGQSKWYHLQFVNKEIKWPRNLILSA